MDASPPPATDLASGTGLPVPADRLLAAKQIQYRVLFSLQHLYRLEAAAAFPARIHLGKARVAWSARDITAWMQAKVDARGPCPFTGEHPRLTDSDRFIGKKELRGLVLYSPQHIRLLELDHQFPARIWIGENRVAWLEREVQHWRSSRTKG